MFERKFILTGDGGDGGGGVFPTVIAENRGNFEVWKNFHLAQS